VDAVPGKGRPNLGQGDVRLVLIEIQDRRAVRLSSARALVSALRLGTGVSLGLG